MSDTDSFIEEVSEEVRRDRFFKLVKRYGWIPVLAVILLVGGATWLEVQKSAEEKRAQAFGDAILAALEEEDRAKRASTLTELDAPTSSGNAVLALLGAAEEGTEDPQEAARILLSLADRADIPVIYAQVATLKAVMIPGSGLSTADRRARLEGLARAGGLMRLLAEEQLALLDIEDGQTDAAVSRLQALILDAEASAGLRLRASQVIVALGGEPAG